MQFEARGMLDEMAEDVVRMACLKVASEHEDLPKEIRTLVAIENAEGQMAGIYRMWCTINDEEATDNMTEDIRDIVGKYDGAIHNIMEDMEDNPAENEQSSELDGGDTSVFDT